MIAFRLAVLLLLGVALGVSADEPPPPDGASQKVRELATEYEQLLMQAHSDARTNWEALGDFEKACYLLQEDATADLTEEKAAAVVEDARRNPKRWLPASLSLDHLKNEQSSAFRRRSVELKKQVMELGPSAFPEVVRLIEESAKAEASVQPPSSPGPGDLYKWLITPLRDTGGSEEVLLKLTYSESDQLRADAVAALARRGQARLLRRALELLHDPNPRVREAAAGFVVALPGTFRTLRRAQIDLTTPLMEALKDGYGEIRSRAIHALTAFGDSRALPALEEAARTDQGRDRQMGYPIRLIALKAIDELRCRLAILEENGVPTAPLEHPVLVPDSERDYGAPSPEEEEAYKVVRTGTEEQIRDLARRDPALINARSSLAATALHYNAIEGQVDRAQLLLELGADVNARTDNGTTPISFPPERNEIPMFELLLAHGADINVCSDSGWTPFLAAAESHRADVAEFLLKKGANPKVHDCAGRTPLHFGAGRKDLAALLLAAGADPNAEDNQGFTPLFGALADREATMLLLENGADADVKTSAGLTLLNMVGLANIERVKEGAAILIERGAAVNAKDILGRTPLHLAAREGNKSMAEFLLKNGADPALTDNDGKTPFLLAAQKGHWELARLLRKAEK